MTRASEVCEQVVIADAYHRTSQRDAIPDAKALHGTQPWEPKPDAIRFERLVLDATPLWEQEPGAIQPEELEQDETQPEQQALGAIQPEVPGQGETQPEELEQDETQSEQRERGETRCELPGAIPYVPESRVAIPFSARYAFLFGPVQQCGFPFVVPFSLQRGIRF